MIYACLSAALLSWGTGFTLAYAALLFAEILFLNSIGVSLTLPGYLGITLVTLSAPLAAGMMGSLLDSTLPQKMKLDLFRMLSFALASTLILSSSFFLQMLEDLIPLASAPTFSAQSLTLSLAIISKVILCASISAASISLAVSLAELPARIILGASKAKSIMPFESARLLLILIIIAAVAALIADFFATELGFRALSKGLTVGHG